jgi:hypothetical protein
MLHALTPIADNKLSLTDPRVLWPTFGLVVILLVAALILSWFDRWRKRTDRSVVSPADQLNAFRLSYERGELSPEEYKRIKAKLAPKIKEQLNVPPTPTEPARPSNKTASPDNDRPGD